MTADSTAILHQETTRMKTTIDAHAAQEAMHAMLTQAIAAEASDLHLLAEQRPRTRVHGVIRSDGGPISAGDLESMLRQVCPPNLARHVHGDLRTSGESDGAAARRDLDFSYETTIKGGRRRFRFNVFYSQGRLGACVRLIPDRVPTPEWAGLPESLLDRVSGFRNGLILVTGVAGSGKSTTLAIVLNRLLTRRGCRVITIEEPIEYVHICGDDALISQREVGVDVAAFADGLKYGLRQDPDVIMVGEIRDAETAQMALTAAETGHLVLSTVHTRDAKGAISRLTDLFPRDRSEEVCAQLAVNLRAVLSQHLLPPHVAGDKRVLALEVMFANLPVVSAIRSNNLIALGDAIQTGRAEGMVTLDECLLNSFNAGAISPETALEFANDRKRLSAAISRRQALAMF
jgi:twitching motility protein PilT